MPRLKNSFNLGYCSRRVVLLAFKSSYIGFSIQIVAGVLSNQVLFPSFVQEIIQGIVKPAAPQAQQAHRLFQCFMQVRRGKLPW